MIVHEVKEVTSLMQLWRLLRTAHCGSQVPVRSLLVNKIGIIATHKAVGYHDR